jgi:hypothetical protein
MTASTFLEGSSKTNVFLCVELALSKDLRLHFLFLFGVPERKEKKKRGVENGIEQPGRPSSSSAATSGAFPGPALPSLGRPLVGRLCDTRPLDNSPYATQADDCLCGGGLGPDAQPEGTVVSAKDHLESVSVGDVASQVKPEMSSGSVAPGISVVSALSYTHH